ncbi:fasciclin domain-containing protein [Streptosporangium lutulentum]|uniref:Surface protein with fasciclin (FAS1) repeats n=1 Tax=Streptosporangium lutulentum TaxID=1461250 RepID=A0ABT9QCQ8_9ACTN|nr:fasciclin domain-containing protein [Streptosporangium lutulentum]MDP9843844.1 putative surface protein with fasciclin (FAS1) repeats [Streptosporangium lutulentum]
MKKSLLASALAALTLAAAPAAQAATTSSFLFLSPAPAPTDMPSPTDMTSPTDMPSPTDMTSPGATASPVGPGCASLPTSGPGSAASMATEPVGTALAANPELSSLAKAVDAAGLTETLNSAKDITVFAPTNAAFDKIPKEELDTIMGDKDKLTKILQNHVVEGRKAPADLTAGPLTTLGGGTLTVTGSGEDYTVGDAKILCGNLQTSNATVYLVDSVLLPGAEASATPSESAS